MNRERERIMEVKEVRVSGNELLRGLSDRMSPMIRLARCQKFLNWLEYEIFTSTDVPKPSAVEIYSTFKKMTGMTVTEDE